MQHVDEGRLHAWLDGELPPAGPEGARALERHLEECAACRARAGEERRIRDGASSILRRADPAEHPSPGVIPFPAPAPARRTARPWVVLGWAASVLIAPGDRVDGAPGAGCSRGHQRAARGARHRRRGS
jgi:anti-sigma factor RsiW